MQSLLPSTFKLFAFLICLFFCAFCHGQTPDPNGIIYVMPAATGTGEGSSWANATGNLHQAIHAPGVNKVFVAVGTYKVGSSSFVMKNGVEIYGGFDPSAGIDDLDDARIMPRTVNAGGGSILDGENTRPVLWNYCSQEDPMNNSAVLDGFTLTNGRHGSGGCVYNVYAAPVFRNVMMTNNIAFEKGGALYNENSSPVIINAIFVKNYALEGGAIWDNSPGAAPMQISNTLFARNEAPYSSSARGSGVIDTNHDVILKNVTMADSYGYGLFLAAGTITIHNSIILGGIRAGGGSYEAEHSLIEGDGNTASGNIDGLSFTRYSVFSNPSQGDYSLRSGSPAINTGSNALYTDLSATDLAGSGRLTNGVIDLGAYESDKLKPAADANGVMYVKAAASGNGSGDSWANATDNLRAAVHLVGVQQVWVAKGTYSFAGESGVWPLSSAGYQFSGHLRMKNDVAVFGGFDPENGIDDLADTRILPNPLDTQGSVLTGEYLGPVIWNIFTPGAALNNSAILDGFLVMLGNTATDGAGINNEYASPTLRNLVIRENVAHYGAGVFNRNASPLMTNVVIKGNVATIDGGGMYNDASSAPVVTNAVMVNNQAGYGGGVYNRNASPRFVNTLMIGNRANSAGGGMYSSNSSVPVVLNSTVATNSPDAFGTNNATVSILNSIVHGGMPGDSYTAQYSLIENNTSTSEGNADFTGMQLNDVFTNPSGSDFTLKTGSPAVDAGKNSLYADLTDQTKDLAGNSRVYDLAKGGLIDMGAYERFPERVVGPDENGIVYVRPAETGNGTGTSWANATASLQEAIDAVGTQKVFVAIGRYDVPSPNSFVMKNHVAIYGGFDPENGIDDLADSRILPNRGASEGSVLHGKNERPVIWNDRNDLSETAILDGFTITGGRTDHDGGGMMNTYGSLTLRNLVIRDNSASYGGGIYNDNAAPMLTDVVIQGNSASASGGGVYSTDRLSSSVLTNVLVTGNTAPYGAGVFIHMGPGEFTMRNVTLAGNLGGSAVYNVSGTLNIRNTLVFGEVMGSYNARYSLMEGRTEINNGNIDATGISMADIFADPANGIYRLLNCSPASDAGMADAPSQNLPPTDLAGAARVQGDRVDIGAYESTFVPAQSGLAGETGTVLKTQTANGTTHYSNACREVFVTVKTTGAAGDIEGPTTAGVWIDQTQPTHYVRRHYEITPANNAETSTGRVTLYFTQEEFDAFNAVNTSKLPVNATDGEGIARLLIEKRGGASSDGTGSPNTYSGPIVTIDPADVDVTWDNANGRWEVTFEVTGFSGFFVKTTQTPLPVRWISVTARLNDSQHGELEWKVAETNVRDYQIERSRNAKDFIPVATVAGGGHGIATYRFTDPVPAAGLVYYRIRQTDLDGTFSFSKIVSAGGMDGIKLLAYPNPAMERVTIEIGKKYMGTCLKLVNTSGQPLQYITVHEPKFALDLERYPAGIYILFTDDGKFVKLVRD